MAAEVEFSSACATRTGIAAVAFTQVLGGSTTAQPPARYGRGFAL
jgi:hypothetical protein